MPQQAIILDALTRDFGRIRALDNVSLAISRGQIFGLLGANGAGKTTTFHILLGLLEPTGGHATVFGLDSTTQGQQIRERCGVLLEHHGLYERLNALDNLRYYGRIHALDPAHITQRSQELLQHFDLWDRCTDPVKTFSKGMKQKLAIARAVLHKPDLLLLDEPTAGLDPVAAAAVRDDLLRLAGDGGMTVVLNTHNLPEAEKLCNQVGVLNAGKLLQVGPMAQVRGGERPRVEITGSNFTANLVARVQAQADDMVQHNGTLLIDLPGHDADATPIIQTVIESGGRIHEVKRSQASLEAVFLELMQTAQDEAEASNDPT